MERIDDNTITITQPEVDDIRDFIRNTLYNEYDRYTDTYYGSKRTIEEGMRYMNPEMYDLAENLGSL